MNASEWPALAFDGMNEADIRAEVIDPLLKVLGYRSGTENNILRERQIELRYHHMFLGRKQPGKDPVLRGKPDYICEVRGFGRWVVEAKSPNEHIGLGDVEQAHSYSVHPEIQAPLFALSNGRSLLVYETNRGPESVPIIDINYDDLKDQFHVLENLLSPSAIQARYPIRPLDYGKPLAPGFGSRAVVVGGFSRYDSVEVLVDRWPPGIPQPEFQAPQNLCGIEMRIVGDTCYRDSSNTIMADIRTPMFHEQMNQFARSLDIEVNRYVCRDAIISEDPKHPSIFECTFQSVIPAGTEMLDISKWQTTVAPVAIPLVFYAESVGHLDRERFVGNYNGRLVVAFDIPGLSFDVWMFFCGVFEVELKPN